MGISTTPVMKCRRCGKFIKVALLETETPDPSGELLHTLMAGLSKIAYCDMCQAKKNKYASEGRIKDWEAGRP
jgi:hypothetical protein